MHDYPAFDGTQACRTPTPDAARGFAEAVGADLEPALRLCRACRFQADCLAYAVRSDVAGIWAGTTTAERAEIRARSRIPDPASISDELDAWVAALRATTSQTPFAEIGQAG